MQSELLYALLYALIAGLMIPAGALLARVERIKPNWLENEFRHSVIAFGGGVLLAAVALVLVPEGARRVPITLAVLSFAFGGIAFFAVARVLEAGGRSIAQFAAMLLDFVPESLALGAMLATNEKAGMLLALLIATQNLPEGFNAYRELVPAYQTRPNRLMALFSALVVLGPLCAWIGVTYLSQMQELLGVLMLFASGGILYLVFQDIAPQARLERHWAPGLGAVAGFLLGLTGHLLLK